MDLFDVPLIKPNINQGDSLIDEPSSASNYDIEDNPSFESHISDSLYYTENTGQISKFLVTEESKQASNEKIENDSEDSEMKQSETSKLMVFNDYSDSPVKSSINFIEYTEFNTRKAEKTHSFDETRYEIVTNSSQIKEKTLKAAKSSQTSSSPIKIIENSSRSIDEGPEISNSSPSPNEKTPKMMKTNPRNLKLDLKSINKSINSRINRKELNFTTPLVVSPEPWKSARDSVKSLRESIPFSIVSSRSNFELEILHSDRFSTRKRLGFIENELEKTQQKIRFLNSQMIESEKKYFIEKSQKMSENHYEKMRLDIQEIKNENLEKENERLRAQLNELLNKSMPLSKYEPSFSKPSFQSPLTKSLEEPKSNDHLKEKIQNLSETKEKIERELRKLGITSQRRQILKEKLEETQNSLTSLKEKYFFSSL